MKTTNVILILTFFNFLFTNLYSQKNAVNEYRRSSLTMVLVEDEDLGKSKDMVIKSYYSNPFPDRYNEHGIKDKVFRPSELKLNEEDFKSAGFYKDTLKSLKDVFAAKAKKPLNPLRYLNNDSSLSVVEPTKEELIKIYLDKYIREKKLPKQIVSTWFNRQEDGKMDWSVIKERGKYSASADKIDAAKTAALESDFLMDWDLISNTYTIFNKMEFYENEPVARFIRDAAIAEATRKLAGKPAFLLEKSIEGLNKVYERTKEGYTVKCNSYLYQLEWDDKIAEKAKSFLFNSQVDSKMAWDSTNLFQVKYLGRTTAFSLVTFKIGEKRTEEQIINLQVKRTIDNALTKLQKQYVQFRPVCPVASVEPLTAKIGKKEGVEPGQTFDILEIEFNEFGIPMYKKVDKVTVDKKAPIWDNRQGSDQEPELDKEGNPIVTPEFTTFKGGKKAQPGLSYLRAAN